MHARNNFFQNPSLKSVWHELIWKKGYFKKSSLMSKSLSQNNILVLSISDEPGSASVSTAILRTIRTQTGSPRLSTSDINDHKWLFSGPAWQLETTVSCAQNGKECAFLDACQRGQEADVGTWVTWYIKNLSPSITCWNLLRQAKDRPRLSHSQRVNQSNSRSLFGWNNAEIDPLPVPAKWQKAEPNAQKLKRQKTHKQTNKTTKGSIAMLR